uniref:Putative secreted protein n=1 Tax=Anopheles darlingi TaxID=43151 RepID=A0A2M4DJ19_ANODA
MSVVCMCVCVCGCGGILSFRSTFLHPIGLHCCHAVSHAATWFAGSVRSKRRRREECIREDVSGGDDWDHYLAVTGRQADRRMGRQAGRQKGRQAGRQADRQAGRAACGCVLISFASRDRSLGARVERVVCRGREHTCHAAHVCLPERKEKWGGKEWKIGSVLEDVTLRFLLGRYHRAEHRPDRFVEHRLEALLRKSRALEVLHRTDLLRHCQPLRIGDRR